MKTIELPLFDDLELRDIPGFEGRYAASRDGRIWSRANQKHNGRHLQPVATTHGYLCVDITDNEGRRRTINVHRLIAVTWLPNPNHYTEIDHIDGNRKNNSATNLRWCTHKQNMLNVYQRKGERSTYWQAVINIDEDRRLYQQFCDAFERFKNVQPDRDTATQTELLQRFTDAKRAAETNPWEDFCKEQPDKDTETQQELLDRYTDSRQ